MIEGMPEREDSGLVDWESRRKATKSGAPNCVYLAPGEDVIGLEDKARNRLVIPLADAALLIETAKAGGYDHLLDPEY